MGFGVWGLGFGVWGLGFGVWGLGFGVWGLGFGVWGLGFRIEAWVGGEKASVSGPGSCLLGRGGGGGEEPKNKHINANVAVPSRSWLFCDTLAPEKGRGRHNTARRACFLKTSTMPSAVQAKG